MTRDYKHSRVKPNRSTPAWIWLLTGFAMGLLVALLVYMNGKRALEELSRAAVIDRSPKPQSSKPGREMSDQTPSSQRRRFDFYTLLPELEVVVPDEAEGTKLETPRPDQAPKPTSGGYILQAGSFQRLQEADSLKAKLALLGVEADIQTVKVHRDTWHRVRIGPSDSLAQLNRIRARLRENNVDTLLMKVK